MLGVHPCKLGRLRTAGRINLRSNVKPTLVGEVRGAAHASADARVTLPDDAQRQRGQEEETGGVRPTTHQRHWVVATRNQLVQIT